jgi:hypothetical protein
MCFARLRSVRTTYEKPSKAAMWYKSANKRKLKYKGIYIIIEITFIITLVNVLNIIYTHTHKTWKDHLCIYMFIYTYICVYEVSGIIPWIIVVSLAERFVPSLRVDPQVSILCARCSPRYQAYSSEESRVLALQWGRFLKRDLVKVTD